MNVCWRLAIHEAGIAVVGRVLGLDCGPSAIGASNLGAMLSHEGATRHRGPLIAMLAGDVAIEALVGRQPQPDDGQWKNFIMEAPVDMPAAERDALADQIHRTVIGLVHRHIGRIDRVARILWSRGDAADAEIRAVAGLPERPAYWLDEVTPEGSA